LTRAAIVELSLIFLAGLVFWSFSFQGPQNVAVGQYMLWLAGLFLVQTLLRDFWLLAKLRFYGNSREYSRIPAFCVESLLGLLGVVAGSVILLSGVSYTIKLDQPGWTISIVLTMVLCFGLRDIVFQWHPWKIYKDPDHANIIVTLK
jgi:hypothetical protein